MFCAHTNNVTSEDSNQKNNGNSKGNNIAAKIITVTVKGMLAMVATEVVQVTIEVMVILNKSNSNIVKTINSDSSSKTAMVIVTAIAKVTVGALKGLLCNYAAKPLGECEKNIFDKK